MKRCNSDYNADKADNIANGDKHQNFQSNRGLGGKTSEAVYYSSVAYSKSSPAPFNFYVR